VHSVDKTIKNSTIQETPNGTFNSLKLWNFLVPKLTEKIANKILTTNKMKIKQQISIDEFDGKRFQVRLVEPSDDRKAVLTHYLHNIA
jgi:hypothetical protein